VAGPLNFTLGVATEKRRQFEEHDVLTRMKTLLLYLTAAFFLYLVSWFFAYTFYFAVWHHHIDFTYLISYFRMAWFEPEHAGEAPASVAGLSYFFFVLTIVPTVLLLRWVLRTAKRAG